MVPMYQHFSTCIQQVAKRLHDYGYDIHTEKWQGRDISSSPQHMMREAMNVSFSCPMPLSIDDLRSEVKPNLPWADDHFEERVGGKPLNPGEQYKNWPYYRDNKSNDVHRTEGQQQFSHSYMERIWPKQAGIILTPDEQFKMEHLGDKWVRTGIRYEYGDLNDVVSLLAREPLTRQAYLPIWFPEDTGVVFGGRVPCTLGYHFMRRGNHLHVVYYIRSCDFFRHFRDDIYLCCLKVRWLIDQLKKKSDAWSNVKPGLFTMHITSMHCFAVEKPMLAREAKSAE